MFSHPSLWLFSKRKQGVTGRKLTFHTNETYIPQLCAHTRTLLSCGVLRMCTALGLTPLALALRYRAKRLFLRPRSPLGRQPLYLRKSKKNKKSAQTQEASHTQTHLDQTGSNMFIPGHPDKAWQWEKHHHLTVCTLHCWSVTTWLRHWLRPHFL